MFSMRTAGYDIGQVNRNPAKMAKAHQISQEKYGYDGCVVDVMMLPWQKPVAQR